jgi:hypothetical protein
MLDAGQWNIREFWGVTTLKTGSYHVFENNKLSSARRAPSGYMEKTSQRISNSISLSYELRLPVSPSPLCVSARDNRHLW